MSSITAFSMSVLKRRFFSKRATFGQRASQSGGSAVKTLASPRLGPNTASPPCRYFIFICTFIGCGSQPRKTMALPLRGALDFGQHAGFAGLHQFEALQAIFVFVDHALHQRVAVVARLDAVELAV